MRVAVAFVLLAAFALPARADHGDEERARGHYEIGLGLYRLGDYRGALKEFAAGYELAHKPGFLLNLGQTYRKLGELREARDLYRQFLAEVRSDDPARPQAQKVLAEIEEAIRKQPATAPEPAPTVSRAAPTAHANAASAPSSRAATASAPAAGASSASAANAGATSAGATSAGATSPGATSAGATSAGATSPGAPAWAASTDASPAAALASGPASAAPPPATVRATVRRSRRVLRIAGIATGAVGLAFIGGGIGSAAAADAAARDLNATDQSGGVFDPAKERAYALDHALAIGLFASGSALAAAGVVVLIVSAR